MNIAAIWVGKLTGVALRLVGRRGNALPGLIVERIFPNFLPAALRTLPAGVAIVSGTNGKTTTTKMLATILAQQARVLTNDTGSNFVRGAITATCEHADWRGRLNADVAVFELDEAHAVRFVNVVRPQRVLLLNVMRDQLDRFGEIDTTAQLLKTVAGTADTALVLNADDPRVAAIAAPPGPGSAPPSSAGSNTGPAASVAPQVSYFGVTDDLRGDFPTDDELYSPHVIASGSRPRVAAELLAMDLGETSRLQMRIGNTVHDIALQAGGAHNAQNAVAAAAMALTFGLSSDVIAQGLRAVEPAFGRGQTFTVQGRRLVLHLVKNPAGFRQTLRTLRAYSPAAVVIAINDDYADGRDVSWLWDVEFAGSLADVRWLLTSGTRAVDMSLRLRYDGVDTDAIEPDLRAAATRAVNHVPVGQTVVVLSTYTAMWALHSVLLDIGAPVRGPDARSADGSTADGSTAGGSTAGGSSAGGSSAGGSTAGGSTAGRSDGSVLRAELAEAEDARQQGAARRADGDLPEPDDDGTQP